MTALLAAQQAPRTVAPQTTKRLVTIDLMRGIAASAVMVTHLTYSNENFHQRMPHFSDIFSRGYLGVWMFFVISGFVIPHAMHEMNYRFRSDALRFLIRRVVRLEPPYLLSVLLALALAYAANYAPAFRGQMFHPSMTAIALQFLYLAPWFQVSWVNVVTWTLAIEFQYYILMLFIAPLLLSPDLGKRWLFLAITLLLSFIWTDERAIFLYLPCFALGFSAFLKFNDRIGLPTFFGLLALFTIVCGFRNGPWEAGTGLLSACLIFTPVRRPVPVLSFLGSISYSLYLLHSLVGARIINLTTRLPPATWIQLSGLALAISASVVSAYVFWRFVEKPSTRLARRLTAERA